MDSSDNSGTRVGAADPLEQSQSSYLGLLLLPPRPRAPPPPPPSSVRFVRGLRGHLADRSTLPETPARCPTLPPMPHPIWPATGPQAWIRLGDASVCRYSCTLRVSGRHRDRDTERRCLAPPARDLHDCVPYSRRRRNGWLTHALPYSRSEHSCNALTVVA